MAVQPQEPGFELQVDPKAKRKRIIKQVQQPGLLGVRIIWRQESPVLQIHRWEASGWWKRKSSWVTVREGLAGARRMMYHILEKYGFYLADEVDGEILKLHDFLRRAKGAADQLARWKHLTFEDKEHLHQDLVILAEQFANFKNELKVLAGRQIAQASDFKDRLGRVNPPAMNWRVEKGALSKLIARLDEIAEILPHIVATKRLLDTRARSLSALLWAIRGDLRAVLTHRAFKGDENYQTANQQLGIREKILQILEEVENGRGGWPLGCESYLQQAADEVTLGNFEETKGLLTEALRVVEELLN